MEPEPQIQRFERFLRDTRGLQFAHYEALWQWSVTDLSGFIREIELTCDDTAHVFAQTLVPAATLAAGPWLSALGNDALGPRLASLGGALRDPLEFARLRPADPLFQRALHAAAATPAELWARRPRYRLATHCLIVQEVFLPDALK